MPRVNHGLLNLFTVTCLRKRGKHDLYKDSILCKKLLVDSFILLLIRSSHRTSGNKLENLLSFLEEKSLNSILTFLSLDEIGKSKIKKIG